MESAWVLEIQCNLYCKEAEFSYYAYVRDAGEKAG